jgi:hypothetical protein
LNATGEQPRRQFVIPYLTVPCPVDPIFQSADMISRPLVETSLMYGAKELDVTFYSLVDSGADFCIFPAQFGEAVGVPVRRGRILHTSSIGTGAELYFHEVVTIVRLDGEMVPFRCEVGFTDQLDSHGVLGRNGFFGLFERIVFKEIEGLLELQV